MARKKRWLPRADQLMFDKARHVKSFGMCAKLFLRRVRCRLSPFLPGYLRQAMLAEGQISSREVTLLHQLASSVGSGCIVEIGSYRGMSAVVLGLGSLDHHKVPVFAIEPHEEVSYPDGGEYGPKDRGAFFKNVLRAGVGEIVRLVNLPSADVAKIWQRPIGLLWIDGGHTYEAVKTDFDGWSPFVVEGGTIAFHDSHQDGPRRSIREVTSDGKGEIVQRVDSITVLRKL